MRSNAFLCGFPSVPLHDRGGLPETPGVYFVFADSADVLYVGMSMNVRQRWRSHHRLSDLASHDGARIYVARLEQYFTEEDVRALEAYCIRRFSPRYNFAPVANIWRDRFVALYRQYLTLEKLYESAAPARRP